METTKKPVRVVNDERWSRSTYVMFEGEDVIGVAIQEESITEAYNYTEDESVTREDIAEQLVAEFERDNPAVEAFWPEYNICYADRYYYRYTDAGVASYLPADKVPVTCRLSLAWDVSLEDVATITKTKGIGKMKIVDNEINLRLATTDEETLGRSLIVPPEERHNTGGYSVYFEQPQYVIVSDSAFPGYLSFYGATLNDAGELYSTGWLGKI